MPDQVCPPLGTGSVDFNAVHEAAKNGDDLVIAIQEATTGGPALTEAPPLGDRSFDELKAIAETEGVDTTGLRSKAALAEAIEAHRAPPAFFAPDEPVSPPPLGPVALPADDDA